MSFRLLAFAALAFALSPPSSTAQFETAEIEDMKIDLWPEYDRPSTLVMYRFRLTAGADLSAPVAIPVPAGVEEPHAVAWRDDKGSLFVADFTRRVEGDRAMVVARLGSREGQLEFYADIAFDGTKRSIRFDWPGGAEVGALSFQVQRPRGASGFQVSPAPSRQWEGEDRLTYALVTLGPQEASARPSIEVRYEKATAGLSAQAAQAAPAASAASGSAGPQRPPSPSESGTEPEESPPSWLLAAGGAVAGALVFALLQALGRTREPGAKPKDTGEREKPIFCPQCGTKGRRTDSFCMNCGARLKGLG
jgi:hypothetical protein